MKHKLFFASWCLLAGGILAQAQTWAVKVRVPFPFGVANLTLPAGEYVLWPDRDELYLRGADGKTMAIVSANRVARQGGKAGKVVFRCYEKECFLSQLWMPDSEQSHEVLTSRSEKEAAKRVEPQLFALIPESSR